MSTTPSAPAAGKRPSGYRIVATTVRRIDAGAAARDERTNPEAQLQIWLPTDAPTLLDSCAAVDLVPAGVGGCYARELFFPELADALAVLPLLIAANGPVLDGAKRLKVVQA